MHYLHPVSQDGDGAAAIPSGRWALGLPHAVLGMASGLLFGWVAAVTGLLIAGFASFVLFLPLTALWLNGGRAIAVEAPAPMMTARSHAVVLTLWTVTAWLLAGLLSVR